MHTEKPSIVFIFASSIYEYSAYQIPKLYEKIKLKLPNVKYIIGCTTGAVVGNMCDAPATGEPVEVEARASLGLLVAELDDELSANAFRLDTSQISEVARGGESGEALLARLKTQNSIGGGESITILLATENTKSDLTSFVTKINAALGTKSFGAVASSVTSLHMPKLFLSNVQGPADEELQRFNNGLVGITLTGNINVESIAARSCLPVGPLFIVSDCDKNEIRALQRVTADGALGEAAPPLVQLDDVLRELSTDLSYSLKRELLLGVIPSPEDKTLPYPQSIGDSKLFFAQKPISFEPMSGSLSVPAHPQKGSYFQFCIRDATATRKDLETAMGDLSATLQKGRESGSSPLAVMMLGSMERGNKVFRFQSWETRQVRQQLIAAQLESAQVAGFFSSGTITSVADSTGAAVTAIMETDSTYAVISRTRGAASAAGPAAASSAASGSVRSSYEDVMTAAEVSAFDDSADGVLVVKRDPESAHSTRSAETPCIQSFLDSTHASNFISTSPRLLTVYRVAGMDYFVPDKYPQPRNVLESMVWDREKEVDRLRERFQMSKALMQAKVSEGKYPQRDLLQAVKDAKLKRGLLSPGGVAMPPCIINVVRASLHNGKLPEAANLREQILSLAKEAEACSPVALSCSADYGTFRGQYEDVDALKLSTALPVICDDFVIYGYQIFKAKSSGADAVRLMASVLTTQEVMYLLKVAKALRILCIVVVSSKPQLLELLATPSSGLQVVSVTSRNMRLWKLQPGKASDILRDAEVRAAVSASRCNGELLLLQEGFSSREELEEAAANG